MVADALIYHPSVTHYLKFVSTTVGRDKLLRTLQYFSRFYAWYLYRTNKPASSIAPFEAVKKSFGQARKILRFGKSIEHFKAAAILVDTKGGDSGDRILRNAAIGRQLGYAGYLTFDSITLVDALGVRKFEAAKRLSQEAARCWFAGLSCSVFASAYALYLLREKEAKLSKEDGESVVEGKKIQKDRAALHLQLVSDLCDMSVPTSALGWLELDDGIVGLAGTVSSLIGVYGQWRKTA